MKFCLDCGKEKSRKGIYCKRCGYKHRTRPSGLRYILHKTNPTSFKKGSIPWNTGKRSKFSGKSKDGLHAWVERNLGKPSVCNKCGTSKAKVFQWSNISGKYMKKLSDWQRLCVKCHCRYDFIHFGARKAFYK